MENYYLDWSELTKRVYITNGKKKKDVTEWYEKIVSEREQVDRTAYALINFHKAKKQPKIKITNLTDNKNTNVSFDTKNDLP